MFNNLGTGMLCFLLCAVRRNLYSLLLGVISRLCSMTVTFPGHLYYFSSTKSQLQVSF